MDFVVELRHVLNFLQQHGFDKAAEAVYERLETTNVDVKPAVDGQERESSPSSAPDYAGDYVDQPQQDGYRSKSADPVLVSSRGASEDADDALEADVKEHGPWYNAEPLTTRLSGSSRLYEDPDIDEYDGMDDLGYTRRVVHNQQEFMLQQLDLRQDSDIEPYFHSSSQQYARNNSVLSGSASSSASLSSPGMSSCKQEYDCATSSWDHSQPHDQQHASTSDTMVTGDAAWDRGPAGIVIAEPVTTPTKDSRRSSNSEPKPCLSRVESLSNSFIDELESCDGQGDASRLSEAGSTAGDLGTPPRHSRATTGDTSSSGAAAGASKSAADCEDVIDLSPPSPPPDCAADAGIDLSNIFELGLRGSSRTSSVDVLYGSVRNWSEADSEAGAADSRSQSMGTAGGSSSRSAPGLLVAAVAGSAASKKQAGSKRQSLANQTASQPAEVESHQQAPSLQQQQQGEGKGDQQAVQQTQQLNAQSLSWQAQQQTQDQLQPPQLSDPEQCSATPVLTLSTTPATAATGSGSGPGFGFSFPTTPPSAVDAAVHEERAERVFSTWASNHSKSGCETLDDEEDTGNSQSAGDSISRGDSGAVKDKDVCETSWEFPATPAVIKAATPAPSSEADVKASTACEAAAVGSADDGAAPAASGAADTVTLAAPVTPFSPGSAAAAVSKRTSSGQLEVPASTRSRGGSRAHSSNMGDRAAAAGSTSSSRRKVSGSWGTGAGAAASPNSTATECADVDNMRAAGLEGVGYAAPMTGPMAGPSADADMASTGTGGYSGSGELPAPRYVVDEAGNLLYEYDAAYVDARYEAFDLKVIHRRRRTGFEDSKEFPIRKNDLIAGRYQVMDFLGSAAFSQAVQALDTATGALVCLKIIKNNKDYFDQSLDEIKLLRYVNGADPEDDHHIVRLYDFFYHKEHLFLVCELLRANLYEFQKYQRENGDEPYFTPPRIQKIAIQVLQSLAFLHSLGLIHSDLKPENILIKSYSRCEVKVIDLGSSCFITDHLSSYVQSRSYRAPEVILGLSYGQKIDLWSLGCILAELATGYVLFQNDSLATLLVRLEGILGPLPSWMISQGRYSNRYYTRSRQIYERNKANGRYELLLPKRTNLRHRVPVADEGFLDFLSYLLTPDPTARPSAEDALQHPWLSYPYPPVEQIPD